MNRALRLLHHTYFCLADPAGFGGTFVDRKRFNDAVFVDPERRFLFTKNEKVGNTTARRTLQSLYFGHMLPEHFADTRRWTAPMLQPSDLGLTRIEDINTKVGFKFAIVRNPYARLLSAYLNKIKFQVRRLKKFAGEAGLEGRPEFPDFVRAVAKQAPQQMNPHWRVQYYNIYCDRIRYDRFVKFENYEAEFSAVLEKFFDHAKIETAHKRWTHAGDKLAGYYTPELAAIVRDTFARDFDTFGYSPKLDL